MNKDTDVAITARPSEDGLLVALAAPCIRVERENLTNIKEAYLRYTEANKILGESTITMDPDNERPRKGKDWDPVMLYDMVKNSNEAALARDMNAWIVKHQNEMKSKKYRDVEGDPDFYLMWDPEEYKSKHVTLKKTLPVGSPAKNEVASFLEIEVDACPRDLPLVNVLDFDKNRYNFEDIPRIFTSLLSAIQRTETKQAEVWVDIIQVSACLDDKRYVDEIDKAMSAVMTKQERTERHLTPQEVMSKHNETIRKCVKRRAFFGFETMMEHLELLEPKALEEWKNDWICNALKDLFNHAKQPLPGMGILAARYMRGTAVYESTSSRTGNWYSYDQRSKCWLKGSPPADRINELAGIVDNMVTAISREKTTEEDQKNNLHLKTCGEMVQSQLNREKIMKEMSAVLRMDSFALVADKNYNMMPFANACVEVVEMGDSRRVVIRNHRKQDFTTKVVGAVYHHDYTWEHPDVMKVMDFFHKFITDPESLEWVLYWCGSLLWRGNRDRCILQMNGGGGNGKTIFVKIVETLGEHAVQLKAAAFYTEKRAGAADTEFYALKGASVAIVEEIEPGRTGRVVVAKNLSGGGRLVLRNLFQTEEMVDSTAKLMFVGNVPLHWPDDQAMRDRLYHVEVDSRFSDSAPATKEQQEAEHHYPNNKNFVGEIDKLQDAIIWVFTEYLKKYVENGGLPYSKKIDEDTKKYWHEHNIYRQFYESTYVEDGVSRVAQQDLFKVANAYFKGRNEYSREKLVVYLRSRLGTYGVDGCKTGYDEKSAHFWGIDKIDTQA
jgi:hypothetical protein